MDLNRKNEKKNTNSETLVKSETKDICLGGNFGIDAEYKIKNVSNDRVMVKENVQFEIEKFKKSEVIDDSFEEASEEEMMNNSSEYERSSNSQKTLKNEIDYVLKKIVNIISDEKTKEDTRIKNLKDNMNDFIHKNNIDPIDVMNTITLNINEMITSQKDCIIEGCFSIQIKQTFIKDNNFRKDDFINKYKKEICSVIDKLYQSFCVCISSADYLEEVFELVIMSLAMRDERIPKINIEGIIKEEFVNCIINDPLIKKFNKRIDKSHFKIMKDYSNEEQFKKDLRNIFFKETLIEEDHLNLVEKIKPNIKFKKDDIPIDINDLVEYILKDENIGKEPPSKKKKVKNKKKTKKTEIKNVSSSNSNLSNAENGTDENEIGQLMPKMYNFSNKDTKDCTEVFSKFYKKLGEYEFLKKNLPYFIV